jgi:HEAT repeat protein
LDYLGYYAKGIREMRQSTTALPLFCLILLVLATSTLAQDSDPVAVLTSDASLQEKTDACRTLSRRGGSEAVAALESLLGSEDLSHMARYALESMPEAKAGAALRRALNTTGGDLKVGVISSLGVRQDGKAVPALVEVLSGSDVPQIQAAAKALGAIDTDRATKALVKASNRGDLQPEEKQPIFEALMACADRAAAKKDWKRSIALYESLLQVQDMPDLLHAAVWQGKSVALLAKGGADAVSIRSSLLNENEDAFEAGLQVVRQGGGGDALTLSLAEQLPELSPGRQILLMQALAQRGGTSAGPALLVVAEDGPSELRVAALRALTRIAYSPALSLMEQLIWIEDEAIARASRDGLSFFPGAEGDAALKHMLTNKEAKTRSAALDMIADGGLDNPAALLLKAAENDEDEDVRVAALKALKNKAGMGEMSALLECLLKARSQAEIKAAENALTALCVRQRRAPAGNINILKALYGNLSDGPAADVTEKVAQLVKSGAKSVEASNGNFGDPTPGLVKQLIVYFEANGMTVSATADEGEAVHLAIASSVPSSIVDAFTSALEAADDEAKLAVLRLLKATESPRALDTIRLAAAEDDPAIKETAMRALCDWPTAEALPDVLKIATTPPNPTIKVLALRAAARLLRQGGEGAEPYGPLFQPSDGLEEKRALLGSLSQVHESGALELALRQLDDETVREEALQAAIGIAKNLGSSAREEEGFFNGEDLSGWEGNDTYWRFQNNAIAATSDTQIPRNEFLWSEIEVRDFYLVVDVKLEPATANAGVQFRSKKVDEHGQASGYQGDIGQDVWGRLYHEHGRGKLDWTDRAESAVKPGEWNRFEILAVGPAIWTSINGTLGVAFLDPAGEDERTGKIALQLHAGAPQTVHYRIEKLVHDPKVELTGFTAEALISALNDATGTTE